MPLVEKSKSGLPCLWEQGGGQTHTGRSQIIAGIDGLPKRAIYIKARGQLSCGQHALIPVICGDYIITADHHRDDFNISVEQITEVKEVRVCGMGDPCRYPDCLAAKASYAQGMPREQFEKEACFTADQYKKPRPYAYTLSVCEFSEGEWDTPPPEKLSAAIEAAKNKATCYHCRAPMYINM